jgi:uncharacterized protein YutE (UPF0331/DUF86 family)
VVDRDRLVAPRSFEQYGRVETRRACERLLQMCIETVIDASGLLVTGLRLGLPGEESDLFDKLAARQVISAGMAERLRRMKGMRNILVHEYGRVDDALIFETISQRLGDFALFRQEVIACLGRG